MNCQYWTLSSKNIKIKKIKSQDKEITRFNLKKLYLALCFQQTIIGCRVMNDNLLEQECSVLYWLWKCTYFCIEEWKINSYSGGYNDDDCGIFTGINCTRHGFWNWILAMVLVCNADVWKTTTTCYLEVQISHLLHIYKKFHSKWLY